MNQGFVDPSFLVATIAVLKNVGAGMTCIFSEWRVALCLNVPAWYVIEKASHISLCIGVQKMTSNMIHVEVSDKCKAVYSTNQQKNASVKSIIYCLHVCLYMKVKCYSRLMI